MKKDFELLPHTADLKVRVYGDDLASFFTHALQGMFQAIKPIPSSSECTYKENRLVCNTLLQSHAIQLDAMDLTSLLVDFLSEALYLSDIYNEAYLDATIHSITSTTINATVRGIKVNGFEVVEIKAVTYHDLEIKDTNGKLQADIVFDI